jgi:hypothetical protein
MMKFLSNYRSALLLGICSGLLLLSACATTVPTEDIIKERATARWNALLHGDLAGAYEFLSPGFRSSVSSIQYPRSILIKRVIWTGAQFIGSDCTETSCKVKILLDYTLSGGLPGVKSFDGAQTIHESWVLIDDNWYLVPEK